MLTTHIELNRKYGHGFQARMVYCGLENILDDPCIDSLAEIMGAVSAAIDEINQQGGHNYKLHEVVRIDAAAIEANKHCDITAAQFARDIATGAEEFVRKEESSDFMTKTIDGQEQEFVNVRGVLLMCYCAWKGEDGSTKKGRAIMRIYCRYLASRGYGVGEKEIFKELDGMTEKAATGWIKQTYAKYVKKSDQMPLLGEIAAVIGN